MIYDASLAAVGCSLLLVGILVGALSAFATIWGLMRFLERFSTWPFAVYRVLWGHFPARRCGNRLAAMNYLGADVPAPIAPGSEIESPRCN